MRWCIFLKFCNYSKKPHIHSGLCQWFCNSDYRIWTSFKNDCGKTTEFAAVGYAVTFFSFKFHNRERALIPSNYSTSISNPRYPIV